MAAPVAQAKGVFDSGSTGMVADVPAGIAANDVLLIITESTDGAGAPGTPTTPSGWTKIFEETQGSSGDIPTLTIFAKVATGSETDTTVSGVLNHIIGNMFAIRGSDGSIQVGAGNGHASTNPATILGITTPTVENLILMVIATTRDASGSAQFDTWTNANLTSITEWEDRTVIQGNGGGIGVAWGVKATAGATGNSTVTQAVADDWRAVHLGFQPPTTPQTGAVGPPRMVVSNAVHRSYSW